MVDDAVALNRGGRYRFSDLIVVPKKAALGLDLLNTQPKEGMVAEEAKWAHHNPSTSASVHVDVFVCERMIYHSLARQHLHKETVRICVWCVVFADAHCVYRLRTRRSRWRLTRTRHSTQLSIAVCWPMRCRVPLAPFVHTSILQRRHVALHYATTTTSLSRLLLFRSPSRTWRAVWRRGLV